jgi:hypothetical protein
MQKPLISRKPAQEGEQVVISHATLSPFLLAALAHNPTDRHQRLAAFSRRNELDGRSTLARH